MLALAIVAVADLTAVTKAREELCEPEGLWLENRLVGDVDRL